MSDEHLLCEMPMTVSWWMNAFGPLGRSLGRLMDRGLIGYRSDINRQVLVYHRTTKGRAAWLEVIGVREIFEPQP